MTAAHERGRLVVHLCAPVTPADLQRLCARVDDAHSEAVVVECWLHGRPDASVVQALARVALVAHRSALAVRVRDDSGHLRPLLELCGLGDVLPGTDESARAPSSTTRRPPDTKEHPVRSVFINLPVDDLDRAQRFWTALGMAFDPTYGDGSAACLVLEENAFAMLLQRDRFADFVEGEVADAHRTTEVLVALSVATREEVDDLVARAVAAGGKPWKPSFEAGPMYGGSFQDPDGHVWELMAMPATG